MLHYVHSLIAVCLLFDAEQIVYSYVFFFICSFILKETATLFILVSLLLILAVTGGSLLGLFSSNLLIWACSLLVFSQEPLFATGCLWAYVTRQAERLKFGLPLHEQDLPCWSQVTFPASRLSACGWAVRHVSTRACLFRLAPRRSCELPQWGEEVLWWRFFSYSANNVRDWVAKMWKWSIEEWEKEWNKKLYWTSTGAQFKGVSVKLRAHHLYHVPHANTLK